jgi:hypothetical protein
MIHNVEKGSTKHWCAIAMILLCGHSFRVESVLWPPLTVHTECHVRLRDAVLVLMIYSVVVTPQSASKIGARVVLDRHLLAISIAEITVWDHSAHLFQTLNDMFVLNAMHRDLVPIIWHVETMYAFVRSMLIAGLVNIVHKRVAVSNVEEILIALKQQGDLSVAAICVFSVEMGWMIVERLIQVSRIA